MVERRTRVSLPRRISPGETIEVRTLIQHPMESGFRRDAMGVRIPRDLLTDFTCHLDGALIFETRFAPGTAANPFVAFSMLATHSGTLSLTWTDKNGEKTETEHPLVVS